MAGSKSKKPITVAHLNRWRLHRQCLAKPFAGKNLMDLIREVGWIYSPGCSTPYIAIWARMPEFKPADLDKLVFQQGKLIQLETLRGCSMLVPREAAETALKVRSRTFTELAKQARSMMPLSEAELVTLKAAVLELLEDRPRTMAEIQAGLSPSLVREFGPDCKRIGLAGSVPLSVNLLKEENRVVKVQTSRKLDSTDYSYQLISELVPEADPGNCRPEKAYQRLAEQYFRAESPARVKDFAWWAGINVTDAMKAAAELKPKLIAIEVEGSKDEFLIPESEKDDFLAHAHEDTIVNLLPYRDTYLKGQREIVSRFVAEDHGDKPFSRLNGRLINDPLATVVVNGQVVGLWEWNRSKKDIDMVFFENGTPKAAEKAIRKRASELREFVKSNLGDIRLVDYGPYQVTSIHELRTLWSGGARVNASA